MAEKHSTWRLKPGSYLGEISALAFLPLPSHYSSYPLLLAGTGSEILSYDLASGELLASFHVFEGVRVHGISVCSSAGVLESRIAVFGEKKVNLFHVCVDGGSEGGPPFAVWMELECCLPRFDHWVLDALFLKDCSLALGLSDNSVAVWDIVTSSLVLRVHSPERCLLYSLRLWGDNLEALMVASGTIYNEIIVWKLVAQGHLVAKDSYNSSHSGCNGLQFPDYQFRVGHLARLSGHEGSIFRLAWSNDGSKLMSVSDDRSARIWKIFDQDSSDLSKTLGLCTAGLTLYGHDARIWDCYISDSILITVGEDCSCRVWGMDGNQLWMIKEHIGRGIWRCLYDPVASLLITAGFDSAVKVHQLHTSSLKSSVGQSGVLADFKDRTEIFSICSPSSSPEQLGLMDSKSEYVRCLCFTQENVLYVATNNGFLYNVKLFKPELVKWTQLVRVSKEVPIICMDLISLNISDDCGDTEDIAAIGDGRGYVTVVRVNNADCNSKVAHSITWRAEADRQLLGIYWCKSLGCSHLFTADPRGTLKLWKIGDAAYFGADDNKVDSSPPLIAVFSSFFGTRVMCLDVSLQEEVLICGDQRGNVSVFPFSNSPLLSTSTNPEDKIPSLTDFKGAHGISSVASISLGNLNSNEVEVRTTGGDGCICYFKLSKTSKNLEFIGMKQVKELSIIRSVIGNCSFDEDLVQGRYAIGFTSTDFIVWNLMDEIKVSDVSCGGWRRPYSFYFGDYLDIQNCFAFVKDHTIHIQRLWVPSSGREPFSKVMHIQFHGREIHTLRFISFGLQARVFNCNDLWIATGCEDGTVRLTRHAQSNLDSWSNSRLLGEHVGGSAVRSLCFISKIHTSRASQTYASYGGPLCNFTADRDSDQFLLISVGAKQVLTSWLLQNRLVSEKDASHGENKYNSSIRSSSISFQWLSTHVPQRNGSMHGRLQTMEKNTDVGKSSFTVRNKKPHSELAVIDKNENDWRYLAVTAFLVKAANCRFTVCFVVVAGSDATLALRALVLPHRLWFDVAIMVPLTSPVLALQHVVFPLYANSKSADDCQTGNAYIIISGSTNGTIIFWDLTETVESFIQSILDVQPEKLIDCQRRPRTGRGSQGGRWWKLSTSHSSEKSRENALDCDAQITDNDQNNDQTTCSPATGAGISKTNTNANTDTMPTSGTHTNLLPAEICEVQPMLALDSVHQSGVNCFHVSELKNCQNSKSGYAYSLVSGGDDQSVYSLVFALEQQQAESDPTDVVARKQDFAYIRKCSQSTLNSQHKLRVLFQNRVTSAHSSAVKGVWTDGIWVFSTGLDQRVRCWHMNHCGKLVEHGHLVISVPEPETLDAVICKRNQYQIAVAGRGMQMVLFSVTCDSDLNCVAEE